jgi:hypothetical protein
MWRRVAGSVFPDVSKEHSAFVFNGPGVQDECQTRERNADICTSGGLVVQRLGNKGQPMGECASGAWGPFVQCERKETTASQWGNLQAGPEMRVWARLARNSFTDLTNPTNKPMYFHLSPAFGILFGFLNWWRRQYVPSKRRKTLTSLHSVTSQKYLNPQQNFYGNL